VSGQERYTRADEYSQLPSERNFLQWGTKSHKAGIVMDCNHIRYVDGGDRMANSYSISHHTLKWMKNCSFICQTWPF
jgi:hypothetical protein